jgi:hypothetical protein
MILGETTMPDPEQGSMAGIDRLGEIGAGEGIRTLDPNLGKVVLYP